MNRQRFLTTLAGTLAAALLAFGAQAQTVKLRFGHAHPEADSQHQAAVQFANRVKARTNGAVEIAIFPNNSLGNDNTMIQGVRGGTIDIAMSGNPFFTGMAPKLNALDLPYQFTSTQQVYKVLDGAVGRFRRSPSPVRVRQTWRPCSQAVATPTVRCGFRALRALPLRARPFASSAAARAGRVRCAPRRPPADGR